jgi:hypothetical protein
MRAGAYSLPGTMQTAGYSLGAAGAGGTPLALPRLDPWKALVVLWDPDAPPGWPQRVSPWEVWESLSCRPLYLRRALSCFSDAFTCKG